MSIYGSALIKQHQKYAKSGHWYRLVDINFHCLSHCYHIQTGKICICQNANTCIDSYDMQWFLFYIDCSVKKWMYMRY